MSAISAASPTGMASISRVTSSTRSAFGSELPLFGGATDAATSTSTSPSPTANLCRPRTADNARDTDDAAIGGCPASTSPRDRCATNAPTSDSVTARKSARPRRSR